MTDEAQALKVLIARLRRTEEKKNNNTLRLRKELICSRCKSYIIEKSGCRACKGRANA